MLFKPDEADEVPAAPFAGDCSRLRPARGAEFEVVEAGMRGCHTRNVVPPVLGRAHIYILNGGILQRGIRIVFTVLGESSTGDFMDGAPLQSFEIRVIAPAPSEQRDVSAVFLNDEARYFRIEGWEPVGPPLW
jgi:hypothetical protein